MLQKQQQRSAERDSRRGGSSRLAGGSFDLRARRFVERAKEEFSVTSAGDQKDDSPFPSDLERDPGIGKSKGSFMTGDKPQSTEGENTFEGDVENDPRPSGRVDAKQLGRTNK
jgi:hypothetical protein